MFRLHLVGLPHRRVGPESCGCAYQSKVSKLCKMLGGKHEIFLYAPESNPVPGATIVPCLTEEQRIAIFGSDDDNRLPAWPTDEQSLQFNLNAAAAILERAEPRDLVLLSGGLTHLPIPKALPNLLCCESGVGYEGIIGGGVFAAYESDAWRHYIAALRGFKDVRWFDRTIPNYFNPEEFPVLNDGKSDHLLYFGRAISRKGPQIALEIAKAAGLPLWVAGAGWKQEAGALVGQDVRLEGGESQLKLVGPVNVQERARLLAGARALLVCTTYLGPFEGVSVEANFAGTPAITTNFGCFTETVQNGVNGFRFNLIRDAVEAVEKVGSLRPTAIRKFARDRYSLAAVVPQFEAWFSDLTTLFEDGWYQGHKPKVEEKKMESTTDWKAEDHPFYEDPANPHLGGFRIGGDEATTYPDLWTWLVNDYKVESVIDVGCGDGVAVRFFETLLPGSVIGVDGVPQPADNIFHHDFTDDEWVPKSSGFQLLPKYDLVWCVEFVEHVEEKFIPNFLETFKFAKTILMTHAMPGQQGHHHVNLRTPTYWIGCMAAIGYRRDEELTKKTRELSGLNKSPFNHFARSGMAFVRN